MNHQHKWLLASLACLGLSACTSENITPPHPARASAATIGEGTAAGFMAAQHTGLSNLEGMGLGAATSALARAYHYSDQHIMDDLEKYGVKVLVQEERVRVILPTDKILDPITGRIKPNAYPVLQNLVVFIDRSGGEKIKVYGNMDAVGNEAFQRKLALRRAQTIAGYLWGHGIAQERLKVMNNAAQMPIAAVDTGEGMAMNRRVDLVFHDPSHSIGGWLAKLGHTLMSA